MKILARPLALLALFATILPPTLFLLGVMGEGTMKIVLLCATVVWFASAPFWLRGGES